MGYNNSDIPDYALLSLTLTKFFGAQVTDVLNEHGSMERCVCIPIDRNDLKVDKNGNVYANGRVTKTQNANRFGWTHYAKLHVSKAFYRKMKELGFEIPYIGSMKPSYARYNGRYNVNKPTKVNTEDLL